MSMMEHTVPNGASGMTLSRYLARAYPMVDVREALKRRDVKVNGARQGGEFPVSGGDFVQVYRTVDTSLDVIYRGGGLLVVAKPQGLPVDVDADGVGADTALLRARVIDPGARLCHRLDAQTGGALMLATDETTHARCLQAFKEHRVGKRYAAIVSGAFDAPEGVYRDRLTKDAEGAKVSVGARGGLPVETRWKVAGTAGEGLARVELVPVTGRTHQLRAHMAHHGHPILGDDKYGDRGLNRTHRTKLCLWCMYLSIDGLEFASAPPEWLADDA